MNQSGNEMKWWEVPPMILEGSISNMPLSKRTPAQCFHFNSTHKVYRQFWFCLFLGLSRDGSEVGPLKLNQIAICYIYALSSSQHTHKIISKSFKKVCNGVGQFLILSWAFLISHTSEVLSESCLNEKEVKNHTLWTATGRLTIGIIMFILKQTAPDAFTFTFHFKRLKKSKVAWTIIIGQF